MGIGGDREKEQYFMLDLPCWGLQRAFFARVLTLNEITFYSLNFFTLIYILSVGVAVVMDLKASRVLLVFVSEGNILRVS